MMDLYYEIQESGYDIYDRNNSLFHIQQYEPYIPNKNKSYEENAQAQIQEMIEASQQMSNAEAEKKKLQEDVVNLQVALTEVYEMMLGGGN